MSNIYIPGQGEKSFDELRIDRAVREYDERLFFARNADTRDWCVYIMMPRPEPPYPVIGFGRELPPVDEVMRLIYRSDTKRHGWQIYDEIVQSQEDYKKQFRVAADEATEESAEVVEHFLRRHGKSPVIKEFISHDVPKGGEASDAGRVV
jgi:hypothetical protein